MLKKLISSSTFKKTFMTYVTILVIPVLMFNLSDVDKSFKAEKNQIYSKHSEDAVRISSNIDEKLKELASVGDSLGNETWVKKYMIDANVYDNEFDILKNLEIKDYMDSVICQREILSFGALLYPYKNTVFTQWGVYNIDSFYKNVVSFDAVTYAALNQMMNENNSFRILKTTDIGIWGNSKRVIPILQSLENVSRPRAVLMLFIDSSYLESFIGNIGGTGPAGILITDDNTTVYQKRDDVSSGKKIEEFNIKSKVCEWNYKISYPDSSYMVIDQLFMSLIFTVLISVLLCIIIAFLLARISYKPLYVLFNKVKSENIKDELKGSVSEYSLIETCFNQLVSENNKLSHVVNDYKKAAKYNALLQLLRGYFKDGQQNYSLDEFGLNYSDNTYFCTMLISSGDLSTPLNIETRSKMEIVIFMSAEKIMEGYDIDYQLFEVQNACYAIILSSERKFEIDSLVTRVSSELAKEVDERCGVKPDVLYGNIEKGLLGISKSYYTANENMQYMYFSRRNIDYNSDNISSDNYYYPTDWEVQLINNLKIGNINTLTNILDEIKTENLNRGLSDSCMIKLISLIMETMVRVLNELNIDSGIYAKQFDSKIKTGVVDDAWNYIYEVGSVICERIKYANAPSTIQTGSRLILYVNNNYNSIDMSLKKLADVFNMSTSSISKMFKDVTGINFYDYICRLRMERAKELLREGHDDINNIAGLVGYENTYSFKRAFIRYEGIKPDDYVSKYNCSNPAFLSNEDDVVQTVNL